MTRARRLRALLAGPGLEFLLEAHNALSARIVEEAGFPGIWASGLALSAQFGVRDSNEASWTQVVDVLELMTDATGIPVLLDGDTGYGNFNNLRRLVRKLEQRQVAGVCIEDKLFPKSNSFLGERQPLADVDEFCGKLKAGKDAQSDPDFCLVARVEALIAGHSLSEALRRAEAYRLAGADALLIHSKASHPGQILEFAREWAGRAPLLIVPTTYAGTPMDVFRRAGVRLAIWGNHMLRAAIASMQTAARQLRASERPDETRLAPLGEVFRLQGAEELLEAELRYGRRPTRAVLLAATRGELNGLTSDRPKSMIEVGGKPLLSWTVDALKSLGVHPVTVVAGYAAETVGLPGIRRVDNPAHATTGELGSLRCAQDELEGDVCVLYGDLLVRPYILRDLLQADSEVTVVVDSDLSRPGGAQDFARCEAPDDRRVFPDPVRLVRIGPEAGGAHGRFIGAARFRGAGVDWLREALTELGPEGGMPELLNRLVERQNPVHVLYVHGHWMDVNRLEDVERAESFLA